MPPGKIQISRRQLLAGGAGVLTAGGAKAVDNSLIGYGHLVGTNLTQQNLTAPAANSFQPSPFSLNRDDTTLRFDESAIHLSRPDYSSTLLLAEADTEAAREMDTHHPISGAPITQLLQDLTAFADGSFAFEFHDVADFFSRISEETSRPYTALAFRGPTEQTPHPTTVREFAGVDPTATKKLVEGLTRGFQRHTRYNTERYLARSIQFNLLFDSISLDGRFIHPTDFEGLMDGGKTPLMCWDFAQRSIEAFQSVSPVHQDVPVIGGRVDDDRHGHVYTALASIVRQGTSLRIPVTFLDYRNAVLFDTGVLSLLFNAEVGAFDSRHRAARIRWGL